MIELPDVELNAVQPLGLGPRLRPLHERPADAPAAKALLHHQAVHIGVTSRHEDGHIGCCPGLDADQAHHLTAELRQEQAGVLIGQQAEDVLLITRGARRFLEDVRQVLAGEYYL